MDLLLPDGLRAVIRDRWVSDAQYSFSAADGDSLTGALGNSISMPHEVLFGDGQKQYSYQISYRKIRGREPRAPEKRPGADGSFQIELTAEHERQTKGLPFQAKKGWRNADSNLLAQARRMLETAGDEIVIDFGPNRFSACRADRRLIDRAGKTRPLGQLLGDEFLDCRIGTPGLFFDPATETWEGAISPSRLEHVITTRVSELR